MSQIVSIARTQAQFAVYVTSLGISVFDAVHGPHTVDGRSRLSAEGIYSVSHKKYPFCF